MKSIWTGTIGFGLVNIPIKMYSAVQSSELDLDMLDKKDLSNIHFKRVNANTGKEVNWENIVRGYKLDERYIVLNDEDLEKGVLSLIKHLPGNKILIDHFLDRCQEAEIDAIFDGDDFHVMGVMEHIEPAGIHSGDSNAVLPQFNLSPWIVHTMEEYAEKIGRALNIQGLINIQFAIKEGNVYVIEANPRASRTTPFIAKAYQIPYLNIATKIMMGVNKLKDFTFEKKLTGFAIKEPVFSFNKFPGVNKELGPEMKSTGEAIRFIKDLRDPYFRQLYKERSMHLSK